MVEISDAELADMRHKYRDDAEVSLIIVCLTETRAALWDAEEELEELDQDDEDQDYDPDEEKGDDEEEDD